MTDANIADSLADHFSRAWDMLIEAVGSFSEQQWREAQDERMQPARIVYHILMGAERYTWLGPADEYLGKRQFNLDWVKTPVEELPSKADAARYVGESKAKTLAWIEHFGPAGLAEKKTLWPWTGSCALAQGLYHLRHLQHHLAELAVEQRRRGLAAVEWQ